MIKSYKKQVIADIKKEFEKELIESANAVIESTYPITPVKSGRLRDSITRSEVSDNTITVGTDVEYAVFVELGTRKMSPRFYLTHGANNAISKIKSIFNRKIKWT